MQIDFVDQLIACLPHTRDFHYAMLEGGIFTKEGEPCVTEGDPVRMSICCPGLLAPEHGCA